MNLKFMARQMAKMIIQHLILPVSYGAAKKNEIKAGRFIFADAHHDSRPESMDRLFWYLKREQEEGGREYEILEFYRDFGKLSASAQLRESVSFMKLYATAGAVILCDNFLPVSSCKKRPETKVIQLWHGAGAFKKFGYDAPDDIPAYYKGNVFANYDVVTVSAPKCIGPFQSAMRQPEGVVRATGIARMDAWKDEAHLKQCREAFLRNYPDAAGKKVLLWAPTFRGNAGVPRLEGLAELKRAAEELGDEWYLIISLHPHLLTYADYASYRQPMGTMEILPCADLVITDYSSILYDASLLQKRLLLFMPDAKLYEEDRGFYMQPAEIPAERVLDPKDLSDAIEKTWKEYDFDRQNAFCMSYLSACDGQACSRIAAFLH
ncbi:MAG: CDP-glycerol glycerophosphotransferase family protein [Lachnospiraceae bacterium]|nr:CDP-glycerol glycerophosphotransferase family protein [Lachnospiraceae bacterium]